MPGFYTPRQMYDSELNPSKGWPSQSAVDKVLPMQIESAIGGAKFGDDTILALNMPGFMEEFRGGMVTHVTRDAVDGQYKLRLGLEPDAVACFLFPNGRDPDVTGDRGNIIGSGKASLAAAAFTGVQAGQIMALVALGAYELESTEFVGTDFLPNTPLTAVGAPATLRTADPNDNPGKIRAYGATAAAGWAAWRAGVAATMDHLGCIGTVADGGVTTNEHGKTTIRFWPEHLPCPVVVP